MHDHDRVAIEAGGEAAHLGFDFAPGLTAGFGRQRAPIEFQAAARGHSIDALATMDERADQARPPEQGMRAHRQTRREDVAQMPNQIGADRDGVDAFLRPRGMRAAAPDLDLPAHAALAGGDHAQAGRLAGDAAIGRLAAVEIMLHAAIVVFLVDGGDEGDVDRRWIAREIRSASMKAVRQPLSSTAPRP